MEYLTIELATSGFQEGLMTALTNLRDKDRIPLNLLELSRGRNYKVCCEFPRLKEEGQGRTAVLIYLYYLARALADNVIRIWEKNDSRKLLCTEYGIAQGETEKIIERLSSSGSKKRDVLTRSFLEYFQNNTYLDLDGFMCFRAHEYKAQYRQALSKAVNDYEQQREDEIFIQILERFMDAQDQKVKTLDLVMKEKLILICDQKGKRIKEDHFDENYGDLVISIILKYAPERVIIHSGNLDQKGDPNFLLLLKEVFKGKVSYCTGCSLCQE